MSKIHRYSVALNNEQKQAAEVLMKEYLCSTISSLFSMLLAESYRAYVQRLVAPTKNPKKPLDLRKADTTAAIYPHPRSPGIMLNRSELEAYYELSGQAIPEGTFDSEE